MDVVTSEGDRFTMAIDRSTQLPSWISWVAQNENLGDVAFRLHFTGYLPVKGVMLPTGFNRMIDFRNISQSKLYVDTNTVDGLIPDLAAPAFCAFGSDSCTCGACPSMRRPSEKAHGSLPVEEERTRSSSSLRIT